MSAFQVSQAHLVFLVRAFTSGLGLHDSIWTKTQPAPGYIGRDSFGGTVYKLDPGVSDVEAVALHKHLARENAASVGHRYREPCAPVPVPSNVDQLSRPLPFNTVAEVAAGIKALDCYEYQSCEHATWKTSEVRDWCEMLRRGLYRRIPGFVAGYEAAPWGIE